MPDTPPATTPRMAAFERFVTACDPFTRTIVAVAITFGFIYLAFVKEVSGDSYTNVFFVVVGYLFGKAVDTSAKPTTTPTTGTATPMAPTPGPGG